MDTSLLFRKRHTNLNLLQRCEITSAKRTKTWQYIHPHDLSGYLKAWKEWGMYLPSM